MEIHVSRPDDAPTVAVLHVDGEINVETHEQLQAEAESALRSGAARLVLDLRKVSAVTSYGIRAISHIFKLLHDPSRGENLEALNEGLRDGTFKSSRLKLVGPAPQVRKILTLAGLDMFLEIHTDLKEAVA
jgi:anti-anti-sigma factor